MAISQVYTRATARRDLVEHYVYLGEQAGIETAERFLAEADKSFRDLAAHPFMGAEVALRRPELTGMRKWQVKGFEKFLIFYMPRADGVSIVRVLHAAQDWWRLMGILWSIPSGYAHGRISRFSFAHMSCTTQAE